MNTIWDPEAILSINEQWIQLEQKWGNPIDLESEDDQPSRILKTMFSSLDLRKTTFDSSFLTKNIRPKESPLVNYKEFIKDLEATATKDVPRKEFFYINGEIMSAASVEEICDKIDEIFKSVDKLTSATSTLRLKKHPLPEIVNCSISTADLSFDDTRKKAEPPCASLGDIDKCIDEAFQQLNTFSDLSDGKEGSRGTVTSLVKKFSIVLKSSFVNKAPKRKRECCDRFRELAEFWNGNAFHNT